MQKKIEEIACLKAGYQRVDKPSHSVSFLCAGAHECQIRSTKVAVLPRLQRFSITLKVDKGLKSRSFYPFVNNLSLLKSRLFFIFAKR
jgi:hypothetical protein